MVKKIIWKRKYGFATLFACVACTLTLIVQSGRLQLRNGRDADREEMALTLPSLVDAVRQQDGRLSVTTITTTPAAKEFLDAFPSRAEMEIENTAADRPPLETILDANNTIIGDVGWLLDFAIVGFGKCGTSTMMVWLREHPEIQAFGSEKTEFMQRRPGKLVRQLYEDLEAGPYIRGYKAPQDVGQNHIMDYYRQHWPDAKLIVGIRHPVRWFESLYNFRIQNLPARHALPHANDLIGACVRGRFHTCTGKGDFAASLLHLGKQNYHSGEGPRRPPSPLDAIIMSRYPRYHGNASDVAHMDNPVFLFELGQLGDSNETRNEQFRQDVSRFMGLKEPLPALPHEIPGKKRSDTEQERRNRLKIDICDDEFRPVRNELMALSIENALWIRGVFLLNPTVFVSSRQHFFVIMDGWMRDPCESAREKIVA